MPYALLPSRGLLSLSGEDTLTFLQGLITNNALLLKDGKLLYAALLTPQGKFLHDFFLQMRGGVVLLDSDKSCLSDLEQRLNGYKLRAKVKIERLSEDQAVIAVWGEEVAALAGKLPAFGCIDPRLSALGFRLLEKKSDAEVWCKQHNLTQANANDYDYMRTALGVPEGRSDLIAEKTILLESPFEDMHGVDFKKGCYVGQELTARTKYRGHLRKFLYSIRTTAQSLPAPGTPVYLAEESIGEMRSHAKNLGFALLNIEQVEQSLSQHIKLRAGDCEIEAYVPDWVTHFVVAN